MTQQHGLKRGVARVLRQGLAAGALVAAVAMVAGPPVLGAAAHTVELTIVAGQKNVEFGFNGYQRTAMTVTIPAGWQVVVNFVNQGGLPHSLIVVPSGADHAAAPPTTPVFAGAATGNLAAGLPSGGKQTLTFEASTPGTYEFVCAVRGHAVAGQWFPLVVSSTAEAPSVTPAGAVTMVVK